MWERLQKLQEAGRVLINKGRASALVIKSDTNLRHEVQELARHYLNAPAIAGCSSCYFDALVELCLIKEDFKMSEYILKRGKILKSTSERRLNVVRSTMTEKKALFHLSANPKQKAFFESLPKDVDAKIFHFQEAVKGLAEEEVFDYVMAGGSVEAPAKGVQEEAPKKTRKKKVEE